MWVRVAFPVSSPLSMPIVFFFPCFPSPRLHPPLFSISSPGNKYFCIGRVGRRAFLGPQALLPTKSASNYIPCHFSPVQVTLWQLDRLTWWGNFRAGHGGETLRVMLTLSIEIGCTSSPPPDLGVNWSPTTQRNERGSVRIEWKKIYMKSVSSYQLWIVGWIQRQPNASINWGAFQVKIFWFRLVTQK